MEEILKKREVIKNLFFGWIGTVAFIGIIMFILVGEIFWIPLLYIALGFLVFVAIIGFFSYLFWKKNPEKLEKFRSTKGTKNLSIFVIIFGIYLIAQGGFVYFSNPTDSFLIKAALIRVFFGVFSIIWGIYHLKKIKKKDG